MLGGNKASVKTKGSITAKFFEFTRIECAGDIRADVLMDCQVQCFGKIIMNGKRGSIIGGLTHGVCGIEVTRKRPLLWLVQVRKDMQNSDS